MLTKSGLDAIIISDSGVDTLSGTNPLKLTIDGHVADIQVIADYVRNQGQITIPAGADEQLSWSSAPKLNGLFLFSYLSEKKKTVALVQNYTREKKLFKQLLACNPRAVIISTPFIFFKKTLRYLARDIRSMAPDIFIIAGGAFIHYSYLLCKRSADKDYETNMAKDDFLFLHVDDEPEIDLYIASPRGEETLAIALERISRGLSLDLLENTARLSGKKYVFAPRTDEVSASSPPVIEWNSLPQPFFTSRVIPLQASNGCPYACSFCNFTKDRRLTFVKPLDVLIEELKAVARRGARYIWFVDDNFRLGRGDLNTVCRRFIKENMQLQWMCFIRASTLKSTDMTLLRQAGCIEVQIGLESGDPQLLRNMNKKADPAMYRDVISDAMDHGINVSCYFIIGFPGETEETAATTRAFIRSIENPGSPGCLSWSIYPFLLSPLAPVYDPAMRKKFGLQGYLNRWSHRTMNYEEAKKLVLKAFFELENSGPIYRGDNLVMLEGLERSSKKEFIAKRHALAKKSMKEDITAGQVISTFQAIVRDADAQMTGFTPLHRINGV